MTDEILKEIAQKAATIIYGNEGGYGSVNANDNGAVSVGKVQWHGSRALDLLKTVIAKLDRASRKTSWAQHCIKKSKQLSNGMQGL